MSIAELSRRYGTEVLRRGARRDPELYGIFFVTVGSFAAAGLYFGKNPTGSTADEGCVNMAVNSAPWHAQDGEIDNDDRGNYKYKYYPNADFSKEPKKAPSALHAVIIPNVNLPKELHERFNKYGKDNY